MDNEELDYELEEMERDETSLLDKEQSNVECESFKNSPKLCDYEEIEYGKITTQVLLTESNEQVEEIDILRVSDNDFDNVALHPIIDTEVSFEDCEDNKSIEEYLAPLDFSIDSETHRSDVNYGLLHNFALRSIADTEHCVDKKSIPAMAYTAPLDFSIDSETHRSNVQYAIHKEATQFTPLRVDKVNSSLFKTNQNKKQITKRKLTEQFTTDNGMTQHKPQMLEKPMKLTIEIPQNLNAARKVRITSGSCQDIRPISSKSISTNLTSAGIKNIANVSKSEMSSTVTSKMNLLEMTKLNGSTIKTIDNDDNDEASKNYQIKIENQKALREKILREKELRRQEKLKILGDADIFTDG